MSWVARLKYEFLLWGAHALKLIPGRTGCAIRNFALPYRCGANVTVWEFVHIDKPSQLDIGDRVSINRNTVINAAGGVRIGSDVLIGPNVTIYSQSHRFSELEKLIGEQGYDQLPVVIESNVWIAAGVIVLPGVTVGAGSVVAAGAVVTKNVEPGVLVGGNPARLIRKLSGR